VIDPAGAAAALLCIWCCLDADSVALQTASAVLLGNVLLASQGGDGE